MKKFKEFAKGNLDILVCIFTIALIVLIVSIIGKLAEDERAKTVKHTKSEIASATIADNKVLNVEQSLCEHIEPTGKINIYDTGFSETIEKLPTDFEIGVCTWADIVLDKSELDLLRTTVYCEAGNQSLETQYMVALVILNRLADGYASDLRGVIYQKGAFAVTKWSNFEQRGWSEQVAQAVEMALQTNEHPRNMYYFRDSYYHSFANNYKCSGSMYFSTEED